MLWVCTLTFENWLLILINSQPIVILRANLIRTEFVLNLRRDTTPHRFLNGIVISKVNLHGLWGVAIWIIPFVIRLLCCLIEIIVFLWFIYRFYFKIIFLVCLNFSFSRQKWLWVSGLRVLRNVRVVVGHLACSPDTTLLFDCFLASICLYSIPPSSLLWGCLLLVLILVLFVVLILSLALLIPLSLTIPSSRRGAALSIGFDLGATWLHLFLRRLLTSFGFCPDIITNGRRTSLPQINWLRPIGRFAILALFALNQALRHYASCFPWPCRPLPMSSVWFLTLAGVSIGSHLTFILRPILFVIVGDYLRLLLCSLGVLSHFNLIFVLVL